MRRSSSWEETSCNEWTKERTRISCWLFDRHTEEKEKEKERERERQEKKEGRRRDEKREKKELNHDRVVIRDKEQEKWIIIIVHHKLKIIQSACVLIVNEEKSKQE